MNVTIKHYEGHRLEWNTESLWQCIHAKPPHRDDLCSAFNILHQDLVAYDTVFKNQTSFPDIKATKDHISQLSFVGVTSVPGSESRIKFTFSHPTFLEFFAALHLTTLPLNEQLAFILWVPCCGSGEQTEYVILDTLWKTTTHSRGSCVIYGGLSWFDWW